MEVLKELKIKRKVYYYVILGILGVILILFLTTYVIPKAMVSLTKAAPSTIVSVGNSYILGDKLLAKADGVDKAVVNVFVLDKDGKGVGGKTVSLIGTSKISPDSQITDSNGKTVFSLTSNTEGQDKVTAQIEGATMSKTVIVTFRN